jgi:long-chain acyl-CoA synthetase
MNQHVYSELLLDSLQRYRDRDCFHIKRNGAYTSWTYGDVHRDLNRCSDALRKSGLKRGDRVAVIGENTPEWVLAYHAVIFAGGITVPIDPNIPAEEIAEILRVTESRAIFCSRTFVPTIREIQRTCPALKTVIVLEPETDAPDRSIYQFMNEGDPAHDIARQSFEPEDHMVIIFTSGTTGKAKGVILMQKNYTAAGRYAIPRMHLTPETTVLAILPLHHVFGFAACIAAPLAGGMDIVFVPRIKGPLILEALNDRAVSMLPAVPKMLTVLYDNIERKVKARGPAVQVMFQNLKTISKIGGPVLGAPFRRKLFSSVHQGFGGNLHLIISGGASLPAKYFKGFLEMGFDIVEGYGLTETFGPITLCPREKPKQGSVGQILPENQVRIESPNDSGIGEVLLRGITVFAGYYKNEEATRQVLDDQGWLHTGDLGYLDDEGYLYLVGRSKDLIVLESGKNVYPDELEDHYGQSELIEELGIFGASVKGREIAAALIVPSADLRKNYSADKVREMIHNEIIRLGRNRPSYKKISDFAVVYQPLPRTSTRKLRKFELREMYERMRKEGLKGRAGRIRLTAVEETLMKRPEFETIVERITAIAGAHAGKKITPRANLELDLGMDSLQKLDLFCRLEEEFRVRIPEEYFTRIQTAGDVYAEFMAQKESEQETEVQEDLRKRIVDGASIRIRPSSSLLYNTAPALVRGASHLLWGARIRGEEHIPRTRPALFVANHQTALDVVWIVSALPWSMRRETFAIGKAELLRYPIISSVLKRSNLIPVERDGDIVESLRASSAVLKSDRNLIVFPEGTRSDSEQMLPFKSGVGLLALETNPHIVPVRIQGAAAVWPRGKTPRLSRAGAGPRVTFGEPFTLQDLIDRQQLSPYSSSREVTEIIRTKIASM